MKDPKLEESIVKIQNGDHKAFTYVVEKYQSLAYNIARSVVHNAEDAEEVAQDAFVKIYRFIGQYNGESRFSSWLYKVVFNTALTKANKTAKELLRNDQLIKSQEKLKWSEGAEFNKLITEDQKRIIEEGLNRLEDEDKLVITLFYLAEKSISEIAEITTWKHSKCKVKLMRSRKKLELLLIKRKSDLL